MLTEDQIYDYLDEQEDSNKLLEFLEALQGEILEQKEHWDLLQNFLYKTIGQSSKQHATLAFKILKTLLKTNSPEILEYQSQLLKSNVENLGSSDAGIRKNAHNLNQFIIKLRGNFDIVLEYYRIHGIQNQDLLIKQKSINSLQSLIINHHGYIQENNKELPLIIADLLVCIKNSPQNIVKASEQTLFTIQKMTPVQNIKLEQDQIQKMQVISQPKIRKNTAEIKSPEQTQTKQVQEVQDKDEIWFAKIIHHLEENQDYQIRQQAIEDLEQFTENQKNNKFINKTLDKILTLLDDPNFKICVTSTNILLKITTCPLINEKLNKIIEKVFSKLGDAKMAMRSQSQRIIKSLFEVFILSQNQKKIKEEFLLERCLDAYEQASSLQKESLLNLILFFQMQIEYDSLFNKLIKTISQSYQDQKEKLKQLITPVLVQIQLKLPQNQLKDLIEQYFEEPNELFTLLKIPMNPIFPVLSPNRTITSEISQPLHSRSSQRFPQEDTPKRYMSPNLITTDSYKIFESQKFDYRTSQYESTQISIGSRQLFKNQENSTDSCFRIASAQNNEQYGISQDKKLSSAFNVKEGEVLGFSVQKNLEDFQSEIGLQRGKNIPTTSIGSTQSINSTQEVNTSQTVSGTNIYKPPIQKKYVNKKTSESDKDNLVIESKEHYEKKTSRSKNFISQDIICINEKDDDEEDKESQQEKNGPNYHSVKYTNNEDLKSFLRPQVELKQVYKDFKTDDWMQLFNAFNILRRIIKNHSELINSSNIGSIMPDILNHVDSLRSGLAKNALLCMQEITVYGRMLDSYLDKIFQKLFKKVLDSNAFIQSQVLKAMTNICQNSTDTKVISWLGTHSSGIKSIQGKLLIVVGLEAIFNNNKHKIQQLKDIEKVIQILATYTSDSNQDVRSQSKNLFLKIRQAFLKFQQFIIKISQ